MVFGKRDETRILDERRPWIVLGMILTGVVAVLVPAESVVRELRFIDGSFAGVSFTGFGKFLSVYMLIAVVYSLYMLENVWRSASAPEKATLKYPLLGMITTGILTLVVGGRILAISLLDPIYIAVHSTGLIALSMSFLFATMRYRLFDVQVHIGRDVASSAISIVIVGVYLLALSVISYLAQLFDLPYDRLTLQVLAVFALFFLVAVLISGKAKRRVRRYLDENFYLNRYDYRKEWRQNAQLMASSTTIDQFLPDFTSQLCESMMAEKGLIWVNIGAGKSASYGLPGRAISDRDVEVVRTGLGAERAHVIVGSKDKRLMEIVVESEGLGWVCALAELGPGDEAIGFILLGPKALGLSYSEEDHDFLTTLADQATSTIENLQLEQRVSDARQMETFNRFASFVIHDLKNTMGMLSLTAENAKDNINDAEFQRDAMVTIRRSVQKMRELIHSLGAIDSNPVLKKERINLSALVERQTKALKSIAQSRGISLQFDGTPAVHAEVDPKAIERIVDNLIHNAFDASPDGGVVRVDVAPDTNRTVRIDVVDQGKGFDPKYLGDLAFRPFHTTKKEGLGIGLIMCKTLAEAHGGDISIESSSEYGSRVTVRVPATSTGAR
jgi:signal transduction histidine kinase